MLPSLVLAAMLPLVPHQHVRPASLPLSGAKHVIEQLTFHFDNYRTGWNPYETTLTPAAVASGSFGLATSLAVDGNVYAQPLVAANVRLADGKHNVLIVATEYNSVYAYDADTLQPLWHANFNDASNGIGPETSSAARCSQIAPWIGISSTPVIDPVTHRIYVLVKTMKGSGAGATFANTLHALSIVDGSDALPPVVVDPGGRAEPFDQHWQVDRIGLLESKGRVYVGFGSSCDINPNSVHGWLLAYDASTLALKAVFNTTPDTHSYALAALWQSTYAPAADEDGNIFVSTGNGDFDADGGGNDYGDSVVRLSPNLRVTSYFTPFDQQQLFNDDGDLGSGGVMLLPMQPNVTKPLAVSAGKQDALYLMNRKRLGGYVPNGPNHVVGEVPFNGTGVWGGPAFYATPSGAYVYYALTGQPLVAYALTASPRIKLVASSRTTNDFGGLGGTIPSVSSDGGRHGIVWAVARPNSIKTEPLTLFAYDATHLGHTLFQSALEYWQNSGGTPFLTPTIANGKVYVGAADTVYVFGLSNARRR
jgi:hypothetical protein